MARPARPWFRFYVEAFADRKLRRLKVEYRWLFAACLGMARQSSQPGRLLVGDQPAEVADIADYAALPVGVTSKGITQLLKDGLLIRDGDVLVVPAFLRRQFESDNVTERTRKHRSQERSNDDGGNVPTPPEGTPPETEADTESENPPDPPSSTALAVVPNGSSPAATSDVDTVWDAWLQATGRTRSVLDDRRQRIIRNALKRYPLTDVVDAVRGWRNSPHHRGENDRSTVYNDLELLLRDTQHIERFRDLERSGPGVSKPRMSRGTQAIERVVGRRAAQ